MRYRLNDLIVVEQSATLKKTVTSNYSRYSYQRLKPGYWYETDDPVLIMSLRDWEAKIAFTPQAEASLKKQGISYRKVRSCNCSGGKIKLTFRGIVFDESD